MIPIPRLWTLCLALTTAPAFAQPTAPPPASPPPAVYTPRENVQRTPMRVSVIDGRSFRDTAGGATYRLYGIETCEPGQLAEFGAQRWPCSAIPIAWLVAATLNKWVACNVVGEKDGVRYARCASNEFPDMAIDLLKTGAAVVDPEETGPLIDLYKASETDAKRNYRGLWGSKFEMPWAYRQRSALTPTPPG